MASISMQKCRGSSNMPTADRACWPASGPKRSKKRSDAPSITANCRSNPGAEFTIPVTFTTRLNRSRDPSSPSTEARILRAVARAAACAWRPWPRATPRRRVYKGCRQFKPHLCELLADTHTVSCIGTSHSGSGVTRQGKPRVSADPVTGSH